jgi:hypothetical protein
MLPATLEGDMVEETRDAARRVVMAVAIVMVPAVAGSAEPFGPSAGSPVDYVLAKTKRYPIVLLGEAHWIRHDALLVAELVPRLAEGRIVLAMETLRASDQAVIDRLLAAPTWNEAEGMRLMRSAAWPYREYLDILVAAWTANKKTPGSIKVVGLAPDPDWRAKGISYDAFMAERIADEVASGRRVLVYCGNHHAFTRYEQPELDLRGRATAFMDRAGNILRRRFGERVFLITLHHPVWCGKEPWSYCLPLDGAIDCAAAAAGRAIGFDIEGSAFSRYLVDPGVYYAHGYGSLSFGEMSDGYIWTKPIEQYELVGLIPLAALAPDAAALRDIAGNNPFSDEKGLSRERIRALWAQEATARADPLAYRKWLTLKGWREGCGSPAP